MKFHPALLLGSVFACSAFAADSDMTGSIQRQIMLRGTPQGGTLTIGSVGNTTITFSVASAAGESLSAVVAKFVGQQVPDESPIAAFTSSTGAKLGLVAQPGLIYVRTTDAGIKPAFPPATLRAQPVKSAAEVRLSWTYPKGSPSQANVFRGPRLIATLSGTVLNYVDKGYLDEHISELTYRVLSFDTDPSGLVIPGDMVEVTTTSPDHLTSDTLSIVPPAIPTASVGMSFELTVRKNAGIDPVTWAISAGALPAGLTLRPGGVIAGTPTAVGVSATTVMVKDAAGTTATLPISIDVKALPTLQTLIHKNQEHIPGGEDRHHP
jgi:hypothetical protein